MPTDTPSPSPAWRHHHGPLEGVICVDKGHARMRWGERLEFTAEVGPGDFIDVPWIDPTHPG